MIAHLRGTIHRLDPGEVAVDVDGVGYRVTVPLDVWDVLGEGALCTLWTSTYVREDRLELFGFLDRSGRTLFEALINLQGIGPRLGIELCAVPRSILLQTVEKQDPRLLQSIKGVGRKTAEKLLVELRALLERKPGVLGPIGPELGKAAFDQDAVSALSSLGYDMPSILKTLKDMPEECRSTEERVAAALRSL